MFERGTTKSGQRPTISPIVSVDDNGVFIDSTGASRMFRGMAVSYKLAPYLPITDRFDPVYSFSDFDFLLFEKLNLNIIRLGLSWAAVQPLRGPEGFDEVYLSKLRSFVQHCGACGIYVLLEAHQDLYCEKFTGDGFPAWAVTRDRTTLPFPMPMRGFKRAAYDKQGRVVNMSYTDNWALLHGSDAVTRAFWGLYTNCDDVQMEFARFWKKIAENFGEMDNVIGYELMNEPWIAARSTVGIPYSWANRSNTESTHLQPMYDHLVSQIRLVDNRSLIFWQPSCGSGGGLGNGFDHVPGQDKSKSVLSFHSYGPNLIDGLGMEETIQKAAEQAKRLGGAILVCCSSHLELTEWDVEYTRGEKELLAVMELADEQCLSWIGWQYKQYVRVAGSPSQGTIICPTTGAVRPSMCKLFSRPYPSLVRGTLLAYKYDWSLYQLTLRLSPSKQGDTEVEVSVTEGKELGYAGHWTLLSLRAMDGASVTVENATSCSGTVEYPTWMIEEGRVEESKLVKIKLGRAWHGEAELIVGMEP